VASVAKCWRQKTSNFAFAGSCTLSEYFPSSFVLVKLVLVVVNEFVIFSLLALSVFVNENHSVAETYTGILFEWWHTGANLRSKTGHTTPTPQPHDTIFLVVAHHEVWCAR